MFSFLCLVTIAVENYQYFSVSCPEPSMLLILSAIYQSKSSPDTCSKDVTNIIRNKCYDRSSCGFSVTSEALKINDPCSGVLKELQVLYSCGEHQRKLLIIFQSAVYMICSSS